MEKVMSKAAVQTQQDILESVEQSNPLVAQQAALPAQHSESAALMQTIQELARDKDFDLERLRQLMQIKNEFQAEEARKSYAFHMARAQAKMPSVVANKWNDQTKSWYPSLDAINEAIKPAFTSEGFSVTFGSTEPADEKLREAGWMCITARCSHSDGHFVDYSIPLPADTVGAKGNVNKTVIHATKSTVSYGRSILMGMMFNFTSSADLDDDGNAAGQPLEKEPEPASEEQLAIIQDFRDEKKIPDVTLKWLDKQGSLTYPQAESLIKKLKEAEK